MKELSPEILAPRCSFARRLVTRLKNQGHAKTQRTLSTVGVIAASPGVPLADFGVRLAAALGKLGLTRHLNSSILESQFGLGAATATDAETKSRIGSWLDQQEAQYKYVIYEADPAPSPWTDLCVRQADRILAVADAMAEPSIGAASPNSPSHAAAQQERSCCIPTETAGRRELAVGLKP